MANVRVSTLRNGIAVGLAFALLGGCGEDSGEGTAQPVNGGLPPVVLPPAVTPSPPNLSAGTRQISGEVFSASGPVVGAGVILWVESPIFWTYLHPGGPLVTDTAGRFHTTGLENDATLIVRVIDDAYKQPCATSVGANASESVRVELFPLDAFNTLGPPRPVVARDQSLTGTIYEITTEGNRRPLSGVHLRIENEAAITIATALTDREGHYYVCGLPAEVVINLEKTGYVLTTVRPVDATKGVPLDIRLSWAGGD